MQSISKIQQVRGAAARGALQLQNVQAGTPLLRRIGGWPPGVKRLEIDLIVLGHYPQPSGGFWWSSPQQRASLAERRVGCCVFVAVSADQDS
jgi:hypothetical protein